MSHTGLDSFETTVHATNEWLNDLMELLAWRDKHKAYRALTVVLHALRDRLTIAEVAALGAQMPLLVRGLYYEGWQPKDKPLRERKKSEFLAHVTAAFPHDREIDPENVVWSVFQLLSKHISNGMIEKVQAVLPAELRMMWI